MTVFGLDGFGAGAIFPMVTFRTKIQIESGRHHSKLAEQRSQSVYRKDFRRRTVWTTLDPLSLSAKASRCSLGIKITSDNRCEFWLDHVGA